MGRKSLFIFVIILFVLITLQGAFGDLTDNLIEYYDFENDIGEAGNYNLTSTGEVIEAGILGNSYLIQRNVGDEIKFGLAEDNFGDSYSINFWVKMGNTAPSAAIMQMITSYTGGETPQSGLTFQDTFYLQFDSAWVSNEDEHAKDTFFGTNYNLYKNKWVMITAVRNTTSNPVKIYINGSLTATAVTNPLDVFSTDEYTTKNLNDARSYDGNFDELGFWNRTLNPTEITELYNSKNGLAYPFSISSTDPTVTNVEITPNPAFDSDNLTCSFDLNNESTGAYVNWYINDNITFSETTTLNSSILVSSYTTLFDNITCSVTPYNSTYNGTTLNDTITVSGYTLNLTAINNQTNASISSFYVSISDSDQVISQWNTTTGSVIITQAYTGIKELSVWGDFYALETYNHTFTINETNLTASLLEVGAIRIKSFDEDGVELNSTEITITNINGDFSQTNTTTGNELYITTNETGNFSILVTKAGYTNRYYYELMNTGRYILLNAYLSNSTEDITFTVQNEFNNLVNNAQISCYTIINSNLVKVAQKTTDYSGQAVIPLDQTTQYIIRVTSGSYLEKEVTLTPSSTAYTIKLESVGLTYTNIMDSISYEFSPVDKYSLDGNVTYNFITSVSDSSNSLDYWGIYLEYEDGTNYTQNFTDSTGGIAIQNLTTPINDTYINAKFFFHKNGYDTFEKNIKYYVYSSTNRDYNLADTFSTAGDFFSDVTKIIIVTLLLLAIVGTTAVFIGFNPLVMDLEIITILGIFTILGWVDVWITALIVIPVIMISFLSRGGSE